jgi:quercetin dioxygenase-like cupin family protein
VRASSEPGRTVGRATRGVLRDATNLEAAAFGPNQVAFVLSGQDTGGTYSLTDFTMAAPPAPGPPPHIHEDADECVYVLEGTLEMGLGDKRILGAAGSVMLAPRGTLHSLVNVGPGPARFIVVLAAPGFEGYWREMADLSARSPGPPDPDVVRGLQRKYRMDTGGAVRRLE